MTILDPVATADETTPSVAHPLASLTADEFDGRARHRHRGRPTSPPRRASPTWASTSRTSARCSPGRTATARCPSAACACCCSTWPPGARPTTSCRSPPARSSRPSVLDGSTGQLPVLIEEFEAVGEIVAADPRWVEALALRGCTPRQRGVRAPLGRLLRLPRGGGPPHPARARLPAGPPGRPPVGAPGRRPLGLRRRREPRGHPHRRRRPASRSPPRAATSTTRPCRASRSRRSSPS